LEEQEMDEYNIEAQSAEPQESEELKSGGKSETEELNDKYLRLYAEFDNYRRRVNRDKEEQAKYGNESLVYELLPILDSLELALKHAPEEQQTGLVQGVEMTLKELQRTLEKFGISKIEAAGKEFDPSIHHAMLQVERKDLEEKMVAEELRAGYLYRDKVLRPSLVAVSVKPQKTAEEQTSEEADARKDIKINFEEDQ
jgi:molecular chaperone GrpE